LHREWERLGMHHSLKQEFGEIMKITAW
jgi:hypothetical protein